MSNEAWYWSLMGVAFVAAVAAGIVTMKKSQKLLNSFLVSSAANALIIACASVWWYDNSVEPMKFKIGKLFFYGIAFVNIEVLVIFILMSIRKRPE